MPRPPCGRGAPAYSPRAPARSIFAVYDRERLGPGHVSVSGPALIEEESATTVVDAGGAMMVDDHGSLIITVAPRS